MYSASRLASAMIVSDGLTDSVRGIDRAVADEQPPDVVRLAVRVHDRSRRVAAHPAASLHVRAEHAGLEHAFGAGRLEHLAGELQSRRRCARARVRSSRTCSGRRPASSTHAVPLFSSLTIVSSPVK